MARYRLSRQAVADLREIASWIARDRPDAAERVVGQLRATFRLLNENPNIGTSCDELKPGMRMFVPSKPAKRYVVFFRKGQDATVEIVTVIDGARDWQSVFSSGER